MPIDKIETELLEALRSGEAGAFEQLYHKYFRMVEDLVLKMSGTREEARDVFQDALFVFVKKVRDPDFELRSKISTFLYAIARNIYLKGANVRNREMAFRDGYSYEEITLPEVHIEDESEKKSSLVAEKFGELEKDCQSVLLYSFYQDMTHAQIAELMGYSLSFVKVKKYRCLSYLRKLVKGSGSLRKFGI